MDIFLPLESLQKKRKLFHSEADFQFALAWEIQLLYPGADVRLEYCPSAAPNMHIDIMVEQYEHRYPIELKYKTLLTDVVVDREEFRLKNHGAQDIGKYDFLADLQRLEYLSHTLHGFKQGYVIWLTNDPLYWNSPKRDHTIADAFSIHDGAVKHGQLRWADHASLGTTKGRTAPINLVGRYSIHWHEYSRIASSGRNSIFKFAVTEIN